MLLSILNIYVNGTLLLLAGQFIPVQDSIIFSPCFSLVSVPSCGCYMDRVHEGFLWCREGRHEGKNSLLYI